jgi:hypothetical protein
LVEILDHEIGALDHGLTSRERGESREGIDDGFDFGIRHAISDCQYRTLETHVTHRCPLAGLLG